MDELVLEKTEPKYFYRVTEFVTTFGMDPGKNESFTYEEDFKGNDLLKCKTDAEKYYQERREGLEKNGKYFLPYESPQDFQFGKNAAFSVTIYLIEYYSEDEEYEHPLIGEDEETTTESRETEMAVLKEKGYLE